MAATNYTVIVKNKKTEKVILINLVSKWTYKQALAIATESNINETHDLICRGQKTKTNARTRKGKKKTIGAASK